MAEKAKILVVEDDIAQSEILSYNLKAAGYDVFTADNGEDGVLLAYENLPDLVILDWMMPRLSGIEVCRQLRAKPETREVSIILLSARSEDADKVRGLELGADDYVAKPYSITELMARVKTQLRRSRASLVGEVIEFKHIKVDSGSHRVFCKDTEIDLGPKEFRLLSAFIDKPGRVLSREQLLDQVWGRDIYVESRTVDVHVGRLRKALTKHGHDDLIRTIRGAGYSLG